MKNELRVLPTILSFNKMIEAEEFLQDRTGVKYVELIAPTIHLDPKQKELNFKVRKTPMKYVKDELLWYDSQDLSIQFIGERAKTWKDVASTDGLINSNYGFLVYNPANYSQYKHVKEELIANKDSRRAIMIYIRPSMWYDYKKNGMNDFVCTLGVHYMIRNNKLIAVVSMRSNDFIYGFFNDYYWQAVVYERLFNDLKKTYKDLEYGNIVWIANSLHVYEKHFKLLKKMATEGLKL